MNLILDETEGKKEYATQTIYDIIWEWLTSQYEIVTDQITGEYLYKTIGSTGDYTTVNNKKLNSFKVAATQVGIKGMSRDKIIETIDHYSENVNFIKKYFAKIKSKHSTDAIDKFCACVKTTDDNLFKKYFKKWLVASVANVYNVKNTNQMCVVFAGSQGTGKSTFIKYLCPSELKKYFYSGDLDLNSKDTYLKLARYWIVDIDEQIKSLNYKDSTKMKSLITLDEIKTRVPYAALEEYFIRIANILASTNDDAFLFDATGSRRFPSFKILSFNQPAYQKINIDLVWSEAYKMYDDKNFVYWIDSKDQQELELSNKNYTHVNREYELLTNFLLPIKNKSEATHALQSSVLLEFLEAEKNIKNSTKEAVGRALKMMGFINDNLPKNDSKSFAIKGWYIKVECFSNNMTILEPYKIMK